MYKISIGFSKGQNPSITHQLLIDRYLQELEKWNVSSFRPEGDTIYFSNKILRFTMGRRSDWFGYFSSGKICIVDDEDEFGAYLEADQSNIFKRAGIFGAFVILLDFMTGFGSFTLIIGAVVFLLTLIINLVGLYVFFPVYFTRLRNSIEEETRRKKI